MGAISSPTRFSLVRISVRDLVADGNSLVRNCGVGVGGRNLILIHESRRECRDELASLSEDLGPFLVLMVALPPSSQNREGGGLYETVLADIPQILHAQCDMQGSDRDGPGASSDGQQRHGSKQLCLQASS